MTLDAKVARLREGQIAEQNLEALAPSLDQYNEAVDREMYKLLDNGQVDPQIALQKWLEKYAVEKLKRDLRARKRAGERASHQLKESL